MRVCACVCAYVFCVCKCVYVCVLPALTHSEMRNQYAGNAVTSKALLD